MENMNTETNEYKGYEYWKHRVDLASKLLKKFNGNHAKVLVYIDDHCPSISLAEMNELMDKMKEETNRDEGN